MKPYTPFANARRNRRGVAPLPPDDVLMDHVEFPVVVRLPSIRKAGGPWYFAWDGIIPHAHPRKDAMVTHSLEVLRCVLAQVGQYRGFTKAVIEDAFPTP